MVFVSMEWDTLCQVLQMNVADPDFQDASALISQAAQSGADSFHAPAKAALDALQIDAAQVLRLPDLEPVLTLGLAATIDALHAAAPRCVANRLPIHLPQGTALPLWHAGDLAGVLLLPGIGRSDPRLHCASVLGVLALHILPPGAPDAARELSFLRSAIDALPDAFAIFDTDDRLVAWNDKFADYIPGVTGAVRKGVTFAELIDSCIASGDYLIPDGDSAGFRARRLATHARPASDQEVQLSDQRWVRISERKMREGARVSLRSDITELKQVQQRLSDIIEGARVAAWEWHRATDQNNFDDRYAEILGYHPDELRPLDDTRFQSLLHPEDAPRVNKAVEETFAGLRDYYHEELRLRHKQGHWVWVQARARVTRRDADGAVAVFAGIYIEITETRALQERLRAEEQFLRQIMETSASGLIVLNSDGHTVFANRAARQIRRISDEAIFPLDLNTLGFRRISLAGVELKDHELAYYQAMKHGRLVQDFRYRLVWPDGADRTIQLNAAALDHPGTGARVVLSLSDITEEAQAEQALRDALDEEARSNARFAEVASIAHSFVWEQGPDLRFSYLSPGLDEVLGIAAADGIGLTFQELFALVPAARADADWSRLTAITADAQGFDDLVVRLRSPTEADRFIELTGKPMVTPAGALQGVRGAARDITALTHARLNAEAANRTKSDFLATMSHEIRTPLNGVLGMADILHERLDDPELRGMAQTIRESGMGLLGVLNDILDMSKIEAGKLSLESAPFDPAALLERSLALHSASAREKALELEVICTPRAPVWRQGDELRLQQVLHNLLSNAIRFTELGSVRVALDAPDNGPVHLSVSDTGIGMTAEQRKRLFVPFEQAESNTARRFGGTGLGLSITRNLVELMDGSIEVTTSPGTGTRFDLYLPLPLAARDAQPLAASHTGPDPRSLQGLRVLAADDNATNRRLLQMMLDGSGVDLTMAPDGPSALLAWQPGGFDIVLLDISMPLMDGTEVLARIIDASRRAGLPPPRSVAVTANAMTHQVEVYLSAGFDAHLAKPFRKAQLLEILAAP